MSDRLSDLLRRRALLQEQLAGLDREIATETAPTEPPAAAATPPAPAAFAAAARRATGQLESALPADAEKILAEFQAPPNSIRSEVRKGCFLYLLLAFAALGTALAALYLHSRTK